MGGTGRATLRRIHDIRFATRYFVGGGVDVGGGGDPLGAYSHLFPLMKSCLTWEKSPQGDGQYLDGIVSGSLDFVHSSHCLEHLEKPHVAVANWLRVLKPRGHLIVVVPEEDLYEQGKWPSVFNADHKHTFVMVKLDSWSPVSIDLLELLGSFVQEATLLKVELLDAAHDSTRKELDQTAYGISESGIEFIMQKL